MSTSMRRNEAEQSLLTAAPEAQEAGFSETMSITLAEPEVQKLGLQDPQAGQKISIEGIAQITSFGAGENGRELVLQIIDLGEKSGSSQGESDRTTVLYPMGNS